MKSPSFTKKLPSLSDIQDVRILNWIRNRETKQRFNFLKVFALNQQNEHPEAHRALNLSASCIRGRSLWALESPSLHLALWEPGRIVTKTNAIWTLVLLGQAEG